MRKLLLFAPLSLPAYAQYNATAGTSAPTTAVEKEGRRREAGDRSRYVKNSAAWLANYERFGKEVLAAKLQK